MIEITIKGPQGSGKTQVANVIANHLGDEGWDVEIVDGGEVVQTFIGVGHRLARVTTEQGQ